MKRIICILVSVVCLAFAAPTLAIGADEPTRVAAAEVATINVNTATVQELQSLPRIGSVTAERIVAYRTEHGDFRSPEDLIKVKGIGAKTLEKIRELISVE